MKNFLGSCQRGGGNPLPALYSSLQERVWEDVAVATSFRQADRSWARRFAVASPRFIGCRSASTVLSFWNKVTPLLGRPILRLQLSGGPAMQAWRARWWSCPGSARWRCPMKDRRRLRTVSGRNSCPVRDRISSLVANSDQCMFRIRLRHQLSSASIVLDKITDIDHFTCLKVHWVIIFFTAGV